MNKISEHLSYGEVVCKCGCGFGLAPDEFSLKCALLFERLRHAVSEILHKDTPLRIISGCRCKKHNATIPGAAPESYHTKGMALDISTPDGLSVDEFYNIACQEIGDSGGVQSYPEPDSHIHIDCRGWRYRKDGHRG